MNESTEKNAPNPLAVVLRFPRRRGRPRLQRPFKDSGTPELVMKRLRNETAEALDLCLERGVITPDQHWCGIHLRWLYTLRYGAPGVRAVDPTHLGGMELKLDDPEWRASREAEYHEALRLLMPGGHAPILMNLCVYNERPAFLKEARLTAQAARRITEEIAKLREAMDILAEHWKK